MFFSGWQSQIRNNPEYSIENCRKRLNVLLWDFDVERTTLHGLRKVLVRRTVEMGRMEDYLSVFRLLGGYAGVRRIIRDEVTELSPKEINMVCMIFNLKKNELKCCSTAQPWRERHWIY